MKIGDKVKRDVYDPDHCLGEIISTLPFFAKVEFLNFKYDGYNEIWLGMDELSIWSQENGWVQYSED